MAQCRARPAITDSVQALTALSDGRIVSGSYDSTIRIWRESDGTWQSVELTGHTNAILALAKLTTVDGSCRYRQQLVGTRPFASGTRGAALGKVSELTGHTQPVYGPHDAGRWSYRQRQWGQHLARLARERALPGKVSQLTGHTNYCPGPHHARRWPYRQRQRRQDRSRLARERRHLAKCRADRPYAACLGPYHAGRWPYRQRQLGRQAFESGAKAAVHGKVSSSPVIAACLGPYHVSRWPYR